MKELFEGAQEELISSLQRTRAAFSHSTLKGTSNEEAVAKFMRDHLPQSIGVTSGQVVDSHGGTSRQMDVILYDALRTPMLFITPDRSAQLVPVEGVIAIIEVKTRVRESDLPGIIENMKSVKTLSKSAYIHTPGPIQTTVNLFGNSYSHFPTIYSLFSFEADDIMKLTAKAAQLMEDLPADQRIDSACYLGQGVGVNLVPKVDRPQTIAALQEGNLTKAGKFDGTPTRESLFLGYPTSMSLYFWYLIFMRPVLQASQPPLDLHKYIPLGTAF